MPAGKERLEEEGGGGGRGVGGGYGSGFRIPGSGFKGLGVRV